MLSLYKSLGGRTKVKISFGRAITAARTTDMLERGRRPMAFSGNEFTLKFRTFEQTAAVVNSVFSKTFSALNNHRMKRG
jgi:hypothetical protein